MPLTARDALLIPPLSLQTVSFIMESGTVRIRPFSELQKTLLRHSPAASFFPYAPFTLPRRTARPQVHRLLHTPFIPRERAKEMSCTHRTALARSRSIHDRGVREALRDLTGCRLFRERKRGTTGLSFVSGNCGAPGFRSVWEAPRNFSFVSWNVSTHAVHATAHCFRGVRGAPLTFPLYRVTSAPVLEASGRRLGGARMSNVLEAFKRHHGFFLCISELQCS